MDAVRLLGWATAVAFLAALVPGVAGPSLAADPFVSMGDGGKP